jgi:molybdopterin-guanine dinucleotide biosynthesis protein A
MVLSEAELTTGFALAGGASRRMGRDKALLPFGKGTLLDHTLDRLRTVCRDVRILTGREVRYEDRGVPVEMDAGIGPLGAILAGLERAPGGQGVFLAIDLPFVPSALLAHLVSCLSGHDAVVPVSEKGPEPLCAVYGEACRPHIRRRLESGERKASAFFQDVRVRLVLRAELKDFGEPDLFFHNLNTPEEFERL